MGHRVCTWWIGWLLASPLRKLMQDPARIVGPWVRDGMTVLEPGPGMGFFTLELARRVGPGGRVVAVDLQPRMLAGLKRRAARAGVSARIETRLATETSLGIDDLAGKVDLVLAFAMVHELPDVDAFFREVRRALAPGGRVLLAEPTGHVRSAEFEALLAAADRAGLRAEPGPTSREAARRCWRDARGPARTAASGCRAPSAESTPQKELIRGSFIAIVR